jgi:hypothetical protein
LSRPRRRRGTPTARQVLQQCRQFAEGKTCNTNAYWLLI